MLYTSPANTIGALVGFDFLNFYAAPNPFSQVFKGDSGTGVLSTYRNKLIWLRSILASNSENRSLVIAE
jgi:hypothetical protein